MAVAHRYRPPEVARRIAASPDTGIVRQHQSIDLDPTASVTANPKAPDGLRYTGDESCVPIRLTRIAAQDDMDIRAFFLGDARTIPTNYRHVLVNPLKLDWPSFASNYKAIISLAVDAFAADGNAFVTEYAGPSDVVSKGNLYSDSWSAAAFTELPVVDVIDTLEAQGLMFCDFDFCQ